MTKKQMYDKITELAKKVPDTYSDFVICLPAFARNLGIEKELIDFMEKNPKTPSSDIIEFIDERDPELPKWDDEKQCFVGDNVMDDEEWEALCNE